MANPEVFYTGNGTKTDYTFTFEYIDEDDIKVSLDDVVTTAYSFANATTILFDSAPALDVAIRIYRDTNVDSLKTTFFAGSSIRAQDLNKNFEQNNYAVQEVKAYTWDNETDTIHSDETWSSADTQIATTAAMDARFWDQDGDTIDSTETWQDSDDYIPTTGAVDSAIDEAITNDIGTDGTGITVTDDGDGTITLGLASNSIDFDRIKNADIITQAEQDASSPSPGDTNIFTASAAARRFDTLVQTATPTGSAWETGKTWYQNDEDKTVYVWDGDSWEAITSGGAFTRLDQVIYVDATNGDDDNNGHRISTPKKTIKSALAAINSDSTYGDGSTILVAPGVYKETAPLDIQKKDVAIIGASVRNVIVHPTQATETNSLFRVNSGSYLQNMTFTGVKASGTRGDTGSLWEDSTYGLPPTQGWNVSFYPDAKIYKSPYIQNCTNFSDSEIDNDALNFYAGTEDKGRAGDLDSAPTGGGLLVNGDTVHDDSPLRSMVADSYTHVGLDGPGIFVTNNGYCQVTSSYAFFNHFHIACINGGQANLAASTSDFGRYSLIADGRSTSAIFTATTSASASSGATTFTIGAPTAASGWHGSATRPQDNMLVDIGGNTYPVLSATANGSGWDVTISRPDTSDRTQNLGLNGAVSSGAAVSFFLRSMVASSGHTMEYVGSGTNYSALPENGGVPVDANQVVETNNGKVWAAITDHNGTFKVGETFEVNQQTGFVNIPAGALSVSKLLANLDTNNKNIVNNVGDVTIDDQLDMNSHKIVNVTDPTNAQDAATKAYVDALESDLEDGQLDNLYFRQDSSETIDSGDTWSGSDSFIATTAAIDARIIDLVDDVGGFVPIADETSFPTANPDVNNGTGTLISIKEIDTSRTPSSGTVTIANGAGSNTVTITGCGTTVLAAGYGCIVETTSTLHTYTFHRLTPLATEVSTVAANVTDISTVAASIDDVNTFAAVYQVEENSDPTQRADGSTLQEGDLVYREDLNVIRAYNGTAYQNITPDSATLADIAIVADDLASFEDLGLITDDLTTNQSGGALETCADNITDIRTLADIEDGTDATDAIQTVAGISSNVTTVAGISSDVTAVAGRATEIGRLGTTDAVADMAILGTSDVVADMAILATTDVVADMNTLATTDIVADLETCADNNANITTVAGSISNVNTVATNISDVNSFADTYFIGASAPTGANVGAGDLWYDSSANTLKFYDGSTWNAISAGIASIADDTTPELGGALDCNNNNLTEVGTVSGDNLQIDFGTI